MIKVNSIYKKLNNKKKAFTLIELLIVIAIIGILFIVLVSKVDFATDKAKATGVQTDFRSFQTAFEQVARENSGYATLGWDTGDDNGDRIRNSYDKGDNGAGGGIAHNGIQDGSEVFVGSKEYGETWTNTFTLVNPADAKDSSAFIALENAINANLDPKLHITITPNTDASGNLTGSAAITMANQARDPWKNEYAGTYISNAIVDNLDRGSIIMYSTGANGQLGTNYSVSGGLVGVEVPGSNINGKDDYVLSVTYSYANGYGEVQTGTAGFSNNQNTLTSNPIVDNGVNAGGMSAGVGSVPGENVTPNLPSEPAGPGEGEYQMTILTSDVYRADSLVFASNAERSKFTGVKIDGNPLQQWNFDIVANETIITISGSLVNTLSDGTHEIEIVSSDGSAKATFNVSIRCRNHYDHYKEECYDPETDTWYWETHPDIPDDGLCDDCGVVYCDGGSTCIDMGQYSHMCLWCGARFGVCYDYDDDNYCDLCKYAIPCYDGGICIDSDKDCYCDSCGEETHEIVDYECVNCGENRCSLGYHSFGNLDSYGVCEWCGTPMCYIDVDHTDDGTGHCEYCGHSLCEVLWGYHMDDDSDGNCDWCGDPAIEF